MLTCGKRSLCPSIIRSFYRSETVMVKPWIHGIVRFQNKKVNRKFVVLLFDVWFLARLCVIYV